MYYINPTLQISTLALIELLIDNGYIIQADDVNIILTYKGKTTTVSKQSVINFLKVRSKPYIYYINQLKEPVPNISDKYFYLLETDKFNSTQDILDRLIYYRGIYLLVKDLPNVQVLVQNYNTKRKLI